MISINQTHFHATPGLAVGPKSQIMLIPPSRISPHYKRPVEISFSQRALHAIGDAADRIKDGRETTGQAAQTLSTDPYVLQSIGSNTNGFNVATDLLSSKWKFIAIIVRVNASGVHGKNYHSDYITGYLTDEPYNQSTYIGAGAGPKWNPHCKLILTKIFSTNHMLTLDNHNRMRASMTPTSDLGLASNHDNVFGNVKNMNNPIVPIDNTSLISNLSIDENGEVNTSTSLDDSVYMGTAVVSQGEQSLSSSISTLSNVIANTAQCTEASLMYTNDPSLSSGDHFGSGNGSYGSVAGRYANSEARNLNYQRDAVINSVLNFNNGGKAHGYCEAYNIESFINTYSTNVITMDIGNDSVEEIPQHYNTKNNIASAMIASALPSYMVRLGITRLVISYDSHTGFHRVDDAFDPGLGTEVDVIKKIDSLIQLLKRELFPMIKIHFGEFSLMVNAGVNTRTDVIVHLKDFEAGNQYLSEKAVYRDHTFLGGIVSPLLGTSNNSQLNQRSIGDAFLAVGDRFNMDNGIPLDLHNSKTEAGKSYANDLAKAGNVPSNVNGSINIFDNGPSNGGIPIN